jgi:hypothetical protein
VQYNRLGPQETTLEISLALESRSTVAAVRNCLAIGAHGTTIGHRIGGGFTLEFASQPQLGATARRERHGSWWWWWWQWFFPSVSRGE